MKILITGGCGFLGHHIIEHFLLTTDWEITIFDKLSYAACGLSRVKEFFDEPKYKSRLKMFTLDFTRDISVGIEQECKDIDYLLHVGAETHVDNSIIDPKAFVYANVVGTCNILEFARKCEKLKAFVYFSTDEVFGPASFKQRGKTPFRTWCDPTYTYKEWDRYNSTNPYSASKAGGEELVLSYMNSFGLPGFITHCMNIFGERQHPEKFIPKIMRYILAGKTLQIHGTPDKLGSGTRFYIHARNVANAIDFLLSNFVQREKYNITGEKEISNLDMAKIVAQSMGKELKYEIVDYHSSRPEHDLRYSLDGSKMAMLGWKPPQGVTQTIKSTVQWTLDNPEWLEWEELS